MDTLISLEKDNVCLFQKTKKTYNISDLIELGKDAIVNIAIQLIRQKKSIDTSINPFCFDYIQVLTNQKNIIVRLQQNVLLVPLYSRFYYGIELELPSGKIRNTHYRNNFYGNEGNFYSQSGSSFNCATKLFFPSVEQKQTIESVLHAIYGGSCLSAYLWETKMTIYETKETFHIEEKSENPNSIYKGSSYIIDKNTGEITGIPIIEENFISAPKIPGLSKEPNRFYYMGYTEIL